MMKKAKGFDINKPKPMKGMVNQYGTALKQKVGRMRSSYVDIKTPDSKLKTPPRSLA